MSVRPTRQSRRDFSTFLPMTTRWNDNDIFGHLNNTVYFELFDTAVNHLLVQAGLLDLRDSPIVGLVVDNRCCFFASLKFPQAVEAGVALERLGTSSVCYRLGLFSQGDEFVAAQGLFTHVYVERATHRPVPVPFAIRQFLQHLSDLERRIPPAPAALAG